MMIKLETKKITWKEGSRRIKKKGEKRKRNEKQRMCDWNNLSVSYNKTKF